MKKLAAILLVLALVAPLSACGRGGKTPVPSATGTNEPDAVTQVSIGLWDLGQPVASQPSGQIKEYIAEKFGVEFVVWPVTAADWKEKIASAAASQTLPDLFSHDVYEDTVAFRQLIDQKLIRDIPEEIFKNYPKLGTMMYRYRNTEAIDGKMWFVPRADMISRYDNGSTLAIWYRLDWALESKLLTAGQAPSWQEFMSLLAYYSRCDLDENGSDDSYAITGFADDLGGVGTVFLQEFGVRDWVLQDGAWVPGLLSNRAKEAVKWANQAYRSGYLDPDGLTQSQDEAILKFCQGKAGMLVADCSPAGAEKLKAALQTNSPGLDMASAVSVLAQPVNPWGVAYHDDTSYRTGIVFNAQTDDGKLKKVFAVMDWMMGEDGQTYLNWGEAGVDYNVTGDGLQTLHKDENGLPVTFGARNGEWSAMVHMATWATDFMPAATAGDYRFKYLETLKSFWWPNNWRKPLFTRQIADPAVQGFDAGREAEHALVDLIMRSGDVEKDWPGYVEAMKQKLNADAVAQIVNDYAKQNGITAEE